MCWASKSKGKVIGLLIYNSALARGRQIVPAAVRNLETHAADALARAPFAWYDRSRTDAKAFLGEHARDELANVAMIIDDENARPDLRDANTIEHVRGASESL
jgi:hypothetical protein